MSDPNTIEFLITELSRVLDTLQGGPVTELEWKKEGYGFKVRRSPHTVLLSRTVLAPSGEAEEAGLPPSVSVASPVVGVFRFGEWRREPGEPMKAGEALGFVEALNVRHAVEAEQDGVLLEIVVEEGDTVEYGQTLFKIAENHVS